MVVVHFIDRLLVLELKIFGNEIGKIIFFYLIFISAPVTFFGSIQKFFDPFHGSPTARLEGIYWTVEDFKGIDAACLWTVTAFVVIASFIVLGSESRVDQSC